MTIPGPGMGRPGPATHGGSMPKTVDILITGGTVLVLDEQDSKLNPGALAIDKDSIVAVGGKEAILASFQGKERIDVPDSIIMPGLVNAHTHAAMTCFRGIADDMELMGWLNEYIFPAEARNANPELAYWGSLLACAEMIKSGTTTFSDMYIFEQETARAAKQAGMRCLVGEVLFDLPSLTSRRPRKVWPIAKNSFGHGPMTPWSISWWNPIRCTPVRRIS